MNLKKNLQIKLQRNKFLFLMYQNEDVTVILLESTLGIEENIKMLIAHEYTHWIREKEINHDIFENCIGESLLQKE